MAVFAKHNNFCAGCYLVAANSLRESDKRDIRGHHHTAIARLSGERQTGHFHKVEQVGFRQNQACFIECLRIPATQPRIIISLCNRISGELLQRAVKKYAG